jgi:hypothetical protein
VRARWLSKRAVSLHVRVVLIVGVCAGAAWWQVTRAMSGNGLSWFYSLEWPAFALLAIAGWWHLVHEDPERYRARRRRAHDWEHLEDPYRAVAPPGAEVERG